MKVKGTSETRNSEYPLREAANTAIKPGVFGELLKDSASEQKHEACSLLLQKIDLESNELRRNFTVEGLKRYTTLVRSFMKEALTQTYQFEEESHWTRSGGKKSSVIVKRINDDLEQMMDSMLSQEHDQLAMVSKLDEIRGLLLDLYV